MHETTVPQPGSPEYEWWSRGAHAEADARNRDLTARQLEVRDVWVEMCRLRNTNLTRPEEEPTAETVATLAGIFWACLPWWRRLRLAWRAAR